MKNENEVFLKEAIRLSREGMENQEGGPFGSVVVKEGKIVGSGCNRVLVTHDPTAHAEITAIRDACERLHTFHLEGCTLYTSCEPCPMCMAAIYWAHISGVYYCNTRQDASDIGFDDSYIYKEIALPPDKRKIALQHIPSEDALQVFKEWENTPTKTGY